MKTAAILLLLCLSVLPARAAVSQADLDAVGVDVKQGAALPPALRFTDDTGSEPNAGRSHGRQAGGLGFRRLYLRQSVRPDFGLCGRRSAENGPVARQGFPPDRDRARSQRQPRRRARNEKIADRRHACVRHQFFSPVRRRRSMPRPRPPATMPFTIASTTSSPIRGPSSSWPPTAASCASCPASA